MVGYVPPGATVTGAAQELRIDLHRARGRTGRATASSSIAGCRDTTDHHIPQGGNPTWTVARGASRRATLDLCPSNPVNPVNPAQVVAAPPRAPSATTRLRPTRPSSSTAG